MGTIGRSGILGDVSKSDAKQLRMTHDLSANVREQDLAISDIDSFHLPFLELADIENLFGDSVRHLS
jgi:hypothetical protein